ncbi:MAG: hypothetical protein KGI27_10125 [Thaumarchaeota archaeon]|nr:hypothetical protein [Nitrososphaerota archaeon]
MTLTDLSTVLQSIEPLPVPGIAEDSLVAMDLGMDYLAGPELVGRSHRPFTTPKVLRELAGYMWYLEIRASIIKNNASSSV